MKRNYINNYSVNFKEIIVFVSHYGKKREILFRESFRKGPVSVEYLPDLW